MPGTFCYGSSSKKAVFCSVDIFRGIQNKYHQQTNIFKGNHKGNNQKNKSFLYFCVIVFVAIFTFNILYKSVDPIFRALCEEKAHEIATIVTNEEATNVMANYKYGDMFTLEKDSNRKCEDD